MTPNENAPGVEAGGAKEDKISTPNNTPLSPSVKQASDASARECAYAGGRLTVDTRGVSFIRTKPISEDTTAGDTDTIAERPSTRQSSTWICSPLYVTAETRNSDGAEWGRLLEWHDDDGTLHRWAMPIELLQGDGVDVRRELARQGLTISPSRPARALLLPYVQLWPVDARARCVSQVGWHGAVYVTSRQVIGTANESVVFQSAHAIEPAFSVAGTAPEWRNSVATMAAGNSRLVFALSLGFAGPLLSLAGVDSGIFHFRGPSSIGKTTALAVAASIWGPPSRYVRSWHSTINGLEGLAALHNDGLLVLDELAQIDPHQAGEAAYLLANGVGKARASRTGTALPAARWRLLGLSAGEQSLSALMAQAGKRPTAGQEIRLVDIEADAGAGAGLFENLHNRESPAAFAQAIKDTATSCHGGVGLRWLTHIVADRDKLPSTISEGMRRFCEKNVPPGAAGQVVRVARRFALVAVAGEMATSYRLTGWRVDEATEAAERCFAVWLEGFGGPGNAEERAILDHVRAFLGTHGASRFQDMDADDLDGHEPRTINRAGFMRRTEEGEREYLVLGEAFRRDICGEFDEKVVKRVLREASLLIPGKDDKPSHVVRLSGLGSVRVYVLRYRDADDDPKEDATAD